MFSHASFAACHNTQLIGQMLSLCMRGGLGSRLLSKFCPDLPAPWIIFSVLPKIVFHCSLNYFCYLPAPWKKLCVAPWLFSSATFSLDFFLCSLNYFCSLLPRLFPTLLPGCFDPQSSGSLKPHGEAQCWDCKTTQSLFHKSIITFTCKEDHLSLRLIILQYSGFSREFPISWIIG